MDFTKGEQPEEVLGSHVIDSDLDIMEQYRQEQNMLKGFLFGLLAAAIGASVWAMIAIATGYSIGFIALGVGFIVGYAVRIGGKGVDNSFGIMAGALALLGCLVGDYIGLMGALAKQVGTSMAGVISSTGFGGSIEIFFQNYSIMGIILCGIAVVEAYKFSFRPLDFIREGQI